MKKFIKYLSIFGAIASIISLLLIIGNEDIQRAFRGNSIEILGLDDAYSARYDDDYVLSFKIHNNGNSYVMIKSISVYEILYDDVKNVYPGVDIEPMFSEIDMDNSVNMNITIPAHEAVGTTIFRIEIFYDNFHKTLRSDDFLIRWYS